jgi:hypothetical protein
MRPAAAPTRLDVKAGATLAVSRRSVKVGSAVAFRGRLKWTGTDASPQGVHVAFDFFNGREWKNAVDRAITDRYGRFVVPRYRFTNAAKGGSTVRIRASVLAYKTDWPFVDGESPEVKIRVHR